MSWPTAMILVSPRLRYCPITPMVPQAFKGAMDIHKRCLQTPDDSDFGFRYSSCAIMSAVNLTVGGRIRSTGVAFESGEFSWSHQSAA